MTEGLKKIYGKEFVVGRPHMTGNPGFGYHYEAKAYPKDKPEVLFSVAYNMNRKGDYGDNYLEVLWSHQGEESLKEILKSQYGDDFFVYIYSFRYNNKKYKLMEHSEVIKLCDGWANIWMEYYVFTDNIDKKNEAKRIYEIMNKFLLQNNIKKYRIIVGYSQTKFKNNTSVYEKCKSIKNMSSDEIYKEKILINYFDYEQLANNHAEINKVTIKDIISAFKK